MEQQDYTLRKSSYKLFYDQLEEVIYKYPNLTIKKNGNVSYLKGILDIPNDNSEIIGCFLIELHFTEKFPFRFPKLFEVGSTIPNEVDWHKYSDSSCCITVEADEILKCKTGIRVIDFIEKHAFAFFANYIYKKEKGVYKNGEYGHYIVGSLQFYSELFKTADITLWIEYFQFVFRNKAFNNDRNKSCFCGSLLKYKKCHKLIFDTLRDIGEEQVLKDLKTVINECESYL